MVDESLRASASRTTLHLVLHKIEKLSIILLDWLTQVVVASHPIDVLCLFFRMEETRDRTAAQI